MMSGFAQKEVRRTSHHAIPTVAFLDTSFSAGLPVTGKVTYFHDLVKAPPRIAPLTEWFI